MNLHARRQVVVGGTVPRGSASREFSQGMLLRMGYRLCVHRLRRRARVVWEALDWRREQILASRYHLYHEICSAGGQGQPWMKAVWLHILCMFLEAWTRHQIAKAEERVQRTRRAEAPAAPANRGSPSLSRRWLQRGGGSWEYALVDEPQDRYLLKQMSSTYFSIAGQFLVDKVTSSSVAASFCRSCLSASSDHVHESSPSAPPPRADVLGPIRTGGSSADGGAFFSRAPLMPADTPLLGVTARESGEGLQDSVHELSPPNGAGSSSGSCTLESQGSASACGTGLPRFSRVHTNTDRGSLDLEGESAARGEASCSTSLPDKPLLIPGIASGTERRMSADVLSPGGLQTTDHETATGYGALRNEVSRQSRSRGRYADVERETFGPLSPEGEPRGGNVDCHSCWTGANSGREALGSSEAAVSVEEVDTHEGKRSRDLHCERHDSKALHNCRSPGEVGREEVQNETAQRRTGGEGGGGEASYENTGRDHSDTGVPDGKEWDSIQLHAHCGTYRSSCPSHLSTLSTSTFSSANTVCSPSSFSECSSSSTSSPPLSSPVHSSSPGTTVTCFKTETEHAVCELCAEADPDAVLLPCGHGGVCEACARLIVEKEHQRARSSGGLRALLGRDTSPASGFAGSLPGQATSLRTPTSASSRQRGDSRFFPLQLPRCPFCRQAVQRVVKLDAACQTQSGCISAYTALVIMDEQGERRRNWKFNSGRR
ncbi:zinc c3hc4 type (ring finger) protein [Cystoisospora suis]|uniref:Zinc c3hc4 type (Ring finger) protein n=1 Tax=Cystoisospora suis TaxID=483139 RepID=A0A2C6KY26_9APIC|nr:zinc c3hc4 type (ring finger) protein [Cystoisospora suis]